LVYSSNILFFFIFILFKFFKVESDKFSFHVSCHNRPVIDQNLYYLGMKYTTATFATAMYNVLPAITFVLAYIFGLERVKLRCIRSTGKVVGTLATVGGAMIMTLVKGPVLDLFWTKGVSAHNTAGTDIHSAIKGAVLVTIGCFSYACFMILQVRQTKNI